MKWECYGVGPVAVNEEVGSGDGTVWSQMRRLEKEEKVMLLKERFAG